MEKQFNISGLNGYYISYVPTGTVDNTSYLTELIQDNDFFPKSTNDSLSFIFKNAAYSDGVIIGSNRATGNSTLTHSEIIKPNELILNKTYYNTFTFYFSFRGSSLFGYTPDSTVISGANYSKHLNRLRIKLYVELGATLIPLTLTDLYFWSSFISAYNWMYVGDNTDRFSTGLTQGFKLNTGLNNESCIDLCYGTGSTGGVDTGYDYYSDYFNDMAENGYNFKVTASLPNFTGTTKNNKDYKLVVKYYNIGVTGTTYPYDTSESMELMSNTYLWYQASSPGSSAAFGSTGGGSGAEAS
jgi:hypothetical protein